MGARADDRVVPKVTAPGVQGPQVVIGVPLYNGSSHVEEALRSLLDQTFIDVAYVLLDDCSSDGTPAIAERTAGGDPRVVIERNRRRLGMTVNWRRVFERARELYPGARYFAWGSDHDRWDPRWLQRLVEELERTPGAVHAYPSSARIDDRGDPIHRNPKGSRFETRGVRGPIRRVVRTFVSAPAGNAVYGLFRAEAIARAGGFRRVLGPDRMLLVEVALQGESALVREFLWFRRFKLDVSPGRQRRAFFPDGRYPLWSYLPWSVQQSGLLAYHAGLRGTARPQAGRGTGLVAAILLPLLMPIRHAEKARRRLRKRQRRLVKRLRSRAGRLGRARNAVATLPRRGSKTERLAEEASVEAFASTTNGSRASGAPPSSRS